MELFKLAWKNIFRQPTRSIITITSILLGILLTMVGGSMTDGSHISMIQSILDLSTGEMQIQHKDYHGNPSFDNFIFVDYHKIINNVKDKYPALKVAPRVTFDGLISNRDSIGAQIIAINPESEKSVSKIVKNIISGEFLSGKGNEILVGKKMLQLLNIKLGDEVVVLSQAYMGNMAVDLFTVKGVFDLHQDEANAYLVYTNLSAAQKFLMIDGISSIVVKADIERVTYYTKELKKMLPSGLVVLPWDTLLPDLKQIISLDSAFGILFFIILMIILAVGVMETIILNIHERIREIGVLLAVGMKRTQIIMLFLYEGIIMVIVGGLLGTILGYLIILHYYNHPIYLESAKELYEYFGADPYMYFALRSPLMWQMPLLLIVFFLVFLVIPIYQVVKLKPISALRFNK